MAIQIAGTTVIDNNRNLVNIANLSFSGSTELASGSINRIINGDMRIDQRNSGAVATVAVPGAYFLDRWEANETSDGVATIQRSVTTPTFPSTIYPVGLSSCLTWTTTTADASLSSAQSGWVQQHIEGFNTVDLAWGTANAKTVTLSFWVRSSLTGTFNGSLTNYAFNRSYVFDYTISSAGIWEYKTVTIAGDTSGTWLTDNNVGVSVRFSLGAGSLLQTTAGSWQAGNYRATSSGVSVLGTLNATWQITGVQFQVGSTATAFERRPYGHELLLCQRYYQQFDTYKSAYGRALSTTTASIAYPLTVPLRASPTLSHATDEMRSYAGGAVTITNIVLTVDYWDAYSAVLQVFVSGVSLVNNATYYLNGTSGGLGLATYALRMDAEL